MIKNHDIEKKNTDHVFQEGAITRFGERLSTLIQGESFKSFAKKCGMSDKAIRDYVSGKTFPALDRIAHIADVTGCSFEWLTTGRTVNEYATYDEMNDSNECHEPSAQYQNTEQTNKSATQEQQQAWLAILNRMKPEEREAIIDDVFRQGINVLLTKPQATNTTQFPCPEELFDEVSSHALVVARMYDSLTDEQRQRFLESIRGEEQKETDRHLSGKSKAS